MVYWLFQIVGSIDFCPPNTFLGEVSLLKAVCPAVSLVSEYPLFLAALNFWRRWKVWTAFCAGARAHARPRTPAVTVSWRWALGMVLSACGLGARDLAPALALVFSALRAQGLFLMRVCFLPCLFICWAFNHHFSFPSPCSTPEFWPPFYFYVYLLLTWLEIEVSQAIRFVSVGGVEAKLGLMELSL